MHHRTKDVGHVGCDELSRFVALWGIPSDKKHSPQKLLHAYLAVWMGPVWERVYAKCDPVIGVEILLYGSKKMGLDVARYSTRDHDPHVCNQLFEDAELGIEGARTSAWKQFIDELRSVIPPVFLGSFVEDEDSSGDEGVETQPYTPPHWKLVELFHLAVSNATNIQFIVTSEWSRPFTHETRLIRNQAERFRAKWAAQMGAGSSEGVKNAMAAQIATVICNCNYPSVSGLEWSNFFSGKSPDKIVAPSDSRSRGPSSPSVTATPGRDPVLFPPHTQQPWTVEVEQKFADDPVYRRFKAESGLKQHHVSRDVLRRFLRTPPAWYHTDMSPKEVYELILAIVPFTDPVIVTDTKQGKALAELLRLSMPPAVVSKMTTVHVITRLFVLGHPMWRAIFSYAWGSNVTLEAEIERYLRVYPRITDDVITCMLDDDDGY